MPVTEGTRLDDVICSRKEMGERRFEMAFSLESGRITQLDALKNQYRYETLDMRKPDASADLLIVGK